MKKLKITQNRYVLVDDEDYEYLCQWKWWYLRVGYAATRVDGKYIYMHRLLNNTPKGEYTDHIDRDKLNNQKSNLRTVTNGQNMWNISKPKTNTSGIKGISWNKYHNKWRARIKNNDKEIFLGYFDNMKEAIKSYNLGVEKYRGELGVKVG